MDEIVQKIIKQFEKLDLVEDLKKVRAAADVRIKAIVAKAMEKRAAEHKAKGIVAKIGVFTGGELG